MTPDRLHEVLSKYAASKGQQLNRDNECVLDILAGLLRNEEGYGYRSCPCRLASGLKERDADIICPCVYKTRMYRNTGVVSARFMFRRNGTRE